jgi:hypothetical protein
LNVLARSVEMISSNSGLKPAFRRRCSIIAGVKLASGASRRPAAFIDSSAARESGQGTSRSYDATSVRLASADRLIPLALAA